MLKKKDSDQPETRAYDLKNVHIRMVTTMKRYQKPVAWVAIGRLYEVAPKLETLQHEPS